MALQALKSASSATLRAKGVGEASGSNTCRRKWTWTFCPPAAVGGGRSVRLERLVTASVKADQWVVGESETSTWSSASSLAQPFKSGRGYIMGRGKVHKLQIALPPENRT